MKLRKLVIKRCDYNVKSIKYSSYTKIPNQVLFEKIALIT
jgi:hypothetical protein